MKQIFQRKPDKGWTLETLPKGIGRSYKIAITHPLYGGIRFVNGTLTANKDIPYAARKFFGNMPAFEYEGGNYALDIVLWWRDSQQDELE